MAELDPLYTAEEMHRFPDARRIALHAGGGANGGDGRIAADILQAQGRELVDERPDVVIDALLGTGLKGAPREETSRLIEQINASGVPVLAVDIPSGVNASTGEVAGAAVQADVTVTMHGPKVGLAVAPGRFHAGEVVVADIGLEPAETEHRLVGKEILGLVPRKRAGDNKYSAGAVLVVGGAPGLTGAACLAAEAAFRADAGYVTVCAPAESLPVVETRLLEAVKRPLEEAFEAAARASALALGPGLGRGDEMKQLVRRLLDELDLPAVVDADALFGFEPVNRSAPTVLTPHSGELARLLEAETAWVDAHRLEAVRRALDRFRCIVLLKGSETIIAGPGLRTLISAGTPRLATAGTGDVLTGIVAAFLAKGMEGQLATTTAARVHADAALAAPQARGLIASDVIAALPLVLERA